MCVSFAYPPGAPAKVVLKQWQVSDSCWHSTHVSGWGAADWWRICYGCLNQAHYKSPSFQSQGALHILRPFYSGSSGLMTPSALFHYTCGGDWNGRHKDQITNKGVISLLPQYQHHNDTMEASVQRKLSESASLFDTMLADMKTLLGNIARGLTQWTMTVCAWMHMPYVCLCMCVCLRSHLGHVEHLKKYRWPACRWDWNISVWGLSMTYAASRIVAQSCSAYTAQGREGSGKRKNKRGKVKQREILMLSLCPSFSTSRGGVSLSFLCCV